MSNRMLRRFAVVSAVGAIAGPAIAEGPIPFQSGRFLSADREVTRGSFSDSLRIEAVTLGHATYRANRNEFVVPSAIRVSIDRTGDGEFEVLTDEALRSGGAPVGFALGRGVNAAEIGTSLDVASALDLARLLYTDGTARVRVDVMLAIPLYDDHEGEADEYPEALFAGSLRESGVDLYAIVGGNLDEPILSSQRVALAAADVSRGLTGVSILSERSETPYPIGMVGVDLSQGFGLAPGLRTIGYRLEIEPGAEAAFTIFGAGSAMQLAAGEEELLDEEELEGASAGSLGIGGGGGPGGRARHGRGDLSVRTALNLYRPKRPVPFRGTRSPTDRGFHPFEFLRDLQEPGDTEFQEDESERDRRRNRRDVTEDDGTTNDDDATNEDDDSISHGGGPGDEEDDSLRDRVKRSNDHGGPQGRDDDPARRERRKSGGAIEVFEGVGEPPAERRKKLADPDSFTAPFQPEGEVFEDDGIRSHGLGHAPVPGPGALALLVMAGVLTHSRRR